MANIIAVTPQQTLELAVRHHQAHQFAQAEQLYRTLLQTNPSHPDALHLLGMALVQTNRAQEGVPLIQKAIATNPDFAPFYVNLAEAHRRAKDYDQALIAITRAIQLAPDVAEAHFNHSAILADLARFTESVAAARAALKIRPTYPEAHFNLGAALDHLGQSNAAIAAFRRAIELKPDYADAWINLGSSLQQSKRLDESIAVLSRAIELAPNSALAHNNMGVALESRGRLKEALAAYTTSVRLDPNDPRLYNNIANVQVNLGNLNEAIAACSKALQLQSDFAEAHRGRAYALKLKGLLDDALQSSAMAVSLNPDLAAVHNTHAGILKDMGQIEQAIASYRRAVDLAPDDREMHSMLLYALHFDPRYSPADLLKEHRHWAQKFALPLKPRIRPHENDRQTDRRLRIGYVSPDLRAHPVGRFLLPLLANHDHQQFEIFCYASIRFPDDFTHRLKSHTDVWRDISSLSDEEAADLIRNDKIDILVDLTMHMAHNRMMLFARKPAPIQVTYLAYAGTTGLDTIDYRITDPHLDPPELSDDHYIERSIRLAETYWCYEPPVDSPNPTPQPAPKSAPITFGSLNNFCKNTPTTLQTWANLLKTVPNSRLILHALIGRHRDHLRETFSAAGIDPQRIQFADRMSLPDYLAEYHNIDIALDPFPYVGGTTTCDALWMGVPVVTLRGQSAIARGGASILTNIGLPELIAQTIEEYVRIAADLASDLPRLADLRMTLRDRMRRSPLMDAPRFAKNIEAAYRQMWRNWRHKA